MARGPATAAQLSDALREIAERTGVNSVQLTAYVDVAGECDHGVVLWARCAACGRPAVPDVVATEVDAHIDRVSGRVLRKLTIADVAALRGVSVPTIRSYRSRYPEGSPNAFPAPLEGNGGPLEWDARLTPALVAWRSVGRGVGGGRRRASAAPAEAARADTAPAVPAVKPRRFTVTAPCLEWLSGSQLWGDLKDGGKEVDTTDADDVVFRKLIDAPTNSKGAVTIDVVSADEAEALRRWADYHVNAARDNAGEDVRSLGEYNAARAFYARALKLCNEFKES